MLATAIIAFREFLEALLIVGVFFGIARKLNLRKDVEIGIAAALGIGISIALSLLTYAFGDKARMILSEENAELLEGYLMVFSGLFIAYVVFSLHGMIRKGRATTILHAHKKLQQRTFDISLFLTIMFLVVREGFEIALFTASTSLFSVFMQNVFGLFIGLFFACLLGLSMFVAYIRFPIGKVFRVTEYMIILLGASLVQRGITELAEMHFGFHLSDIVRLPLSFLPDQHGIFGHLIQTLFGIDSELSLLRVGIMVFYVAMLYLLFKQQIVTRFVKRFIRSTVHK